MKTPVTEVCWIICPVSDPLPQVRTSKPNPKESGSCVVCLADNSNEDEAAFLQKMGSLFMYE